MSFANKLIVLLLDKENPKLIRIYLKGNSLSYTGYFTEFDSYFITLMNYSGKNKEYTYIKTEEIAAFNQIHPPGKY